MSDQPTFAEWLERRADRVVDLGFAAPEEHRVDWFRLQTRLLARDAVRFSRMGLRDDDPMPGL